MYSLFVSDASVIPHNNNIHSNVVYTEGHQTMCQSYSPHHTPRYYIIQHVSFIMIFINDLFNTCFPLGCWCQAGGEVLKIQCNDDCDL